MNTLFIVIIVFFVGGIFGYFIAALMVAGRITDLEYEIMSLRESDGKIRKITA